MTNEQLTMTIEQEYAMAQTGCVAIDASAWGRLKFTGKNRVDFLHRMSTNDLLTLTVGQGTGTVFTTPIARIIDRTVSTCAPMMC
jgi:folate-binding Fe-S cluster repair protein YgfZ